MYKKDLALLTRCIRCAPGCASPASHQRRYVCVQTAHCVQIAGFMRAVANHVMSASACLFTPVNHWGRLTSPKWSCRRKGPTCIRQWDAALFGSKCLLQLTLQATGVSLLLLCTHQQVAFTLHSRTLASSVPEAHLSVCKRLLLPSAHPV